MMTTTNDPCIYCGDPTAFGSTREDEETGEYKDGYACAECAGFGCDECDKPIYLDCETRVDFQDESGKFHYGNFHTECYEETKHGKAKYGENIPMKGE